MLKIFFFFENTLLCSCTLIPMSKPIQEWRKPLSDPDPRKEKSFPFCAPPKSWNSCTILLTFNVQKRTKTKFSFRKSKHISGHLRREVMWFLWLTNTVLKHTTTTLLPMGLPLVLECYWLSKTVSGCFFFFPFSLWLHKHNIKLWFSIPFTNVQHDLAHSSGLRLNSLMTFKTYLNCSF